MSPSGADTVELLCVPRALTEQVLPFVIRMLEASYDEADGIIPDDLVERLKAGTLTLWVAMMAGHSPFAAILTSFYEKKSGRALRIHACGGDHMHVWKNLMVDLEAYAKAEGCVKIVAEARTGWLRVLKGFEPSRIVIEKRL